MLKSQDVSSAAAGMVADLRLRYVREPAFLLLLTAVATVCFAAVSGLSGHYHRHQKSLGAYWFKRGEVGLKQQRYEQAVSEFQLALQYAPANYAYQFHLAEALVGQHRLDEASTYLLSLWERQPENGHVNLELARIAVRQGDSRQAQRYYHNAIYATWPTGQEAARRRTRLELIGYLLKRNLMAEARSELIALEANLGDDPPVRAEVGSLFMQAGDYTDALAAFRASLRSLSSNPSVWAGAGRAALQLGRYRQAQHYLHVAVRSGSKDPDTTSQLEIAEWAGRLDPFQPRISDEQRSRMVMEAFQIAGARLEACAGSADGMPAALAQPNAAWTAMKRELTKRRLIRDADLAETVMDLIFQIQRLSAPCAAPGAADKALLLIGRMHESG